MQLFRAALSNAINIFNSLEKMEIMNNVFGISSTFEPF